MSVSSTGVSLGGVILAPLGAALVERGGMQSLLVSEIYGVVSFGTVFGIISMAGQMPSGFGPFAIGFLDDRTGSYDLVHHHRLHHAGRRRHRGPRAAAAAAPARGPGEQLTVRRSTAPGLALTPPGGKRKVDTNQFAYELRKVTSAAQPFVRSTPRSPPR